MLRTPLLSCGKVRSSTLRGKMLRRDFITRLTGAAARARGKEMKRRDVRALIAGAAAWPMVVRAQQRRRVPKVGVLWHAADADGEWPYYGWLLAGVEELGYSPG